ncbi:MAG: CopG family transcriptional regulator [Sphingomonadales bacterium 32-68-7]|nr:MAG: CopG family transcriptional regulator [Sphingomonadales bacterium 12-68-11]OYX10412.1 MAG: CopG family transcriptional regulator [Sphingomonadales bacterium 32-68-7]
MALRGARPVRYQLFLPRPLSERFEQLAAAPGASKSGLLTAALEAWLNRRGADELEQRFALRLDRLSNQLARIERDGQVQLESLALFVRYMLTVNPPVADEDEAARAVGRDRFAAFVERVGRQLASGRATFLPDDAA